MRIIYILPLLFAMACAMPFQKKKSGSEPFTYSNSSETSDSSLFMSHSAASSEYRASRTKYWDLIHTKLSLSFDYKNREVNGVAALQLRPWFYPQDSLVLDAKFMSIAAVKSLKPAVNLTWTSDTSHIYIRFNAIQKDTIVLEIVYTAKPESRKGRGSSAITDDRGIYFINPDSSDPMKPTEIWTQGETESASGWFPTIDAPNEKMTQEISLLVDSALQTLSNGKLVKTQWLGNGKKIDFWEQKKPHSPYLAMVAVGPWKVYKDKWRDTVQVNYYMEQEYAPYAKLIFGNTPEMLELFSKRLGVAYPWDKFSQVVVRDFVSGAMENTSAVVHGEFLNHDSREHLDNSGEDVVSHELFHHWFGDLVTCESWSNLPLNESFATYGEYMWREYKYGKDDAEYHRQGNLNRYLAEADNKQEPLIRYYYHDKEDMFDAHSYQKGGLVLYTLRSLVGDEAFYKSLELYLKKNSFKSTEIHDLRMAFEEVTGRDLQPFFNEFFMTAGHPVFSLESSFKNDTKELILNISQTGNHNYHIPLDIEVFAGGNKQMLHLNTRPEQEEYIFKLSGQPEYINPDPGKSWLIQWNRAQTAEAWRKQYLNSSVFMDQYEALEAIRLYINADAENQKIALALIQDALLSEKKGIVLTALNVLDDIEELSTINKIFKADLIKLMSHSEATVRGKAMSLLNKLSDSTLFSIYQKAAYDSSYQVLTNALSGIIKYDSAFALKVALEYIKSPNRHLQLAALPVVSDMGQSGLAEIYKNLMSNFSVNSRITIISYMGNYLAVTADSSETQLCLALLRKEAVLPGTPWYYGYFIRGALEYAERNQKNKTISELINQTLEALPAGGSIRIEKN